jgi:phosphoglycolate phosphatase
MSKIHNILFDLDGTLIDSSGAILESLTYALERMDSGWPPGLRVESLIGTPLLEIFRDRFGISGEQAEIGIGHYRDHYDRRARAGSRVYDRVEELLGVLVGSGRRLYVATVKPTPIARKVLTEMGLMSFFSGVAGSSLDHSRRKKSDIIRHAMDRFGLESDRSVMVGDRQQDIAGGRRNGMRTVAVTYGYGTAEELESARPDHTIGCISHLAPLVLADAPETE